MGPERGARGKHREKNGKLIDFFSLRQVKIGARASILLFVVSGISSTLFSGFGGT